MSRLNNDKIAKAIQKKFQNTAKIKGDIDVEWVKTILSAVDRVNNLSQYDQRVDTGNNDEKTVRLDEILLPTWVKPLLLPKTVTLNDGPRYVDLKLRETGDIASFTLKGVIEASENIARFFRENPSYIDNLTEVVMERITFSEVKFPSYMVSDSKVEQTKGATDSSIEKVIFEGDREDLGMPIPLNSSICEASGDKPYLNMSFETYMVDHWIPRYLNWPARQ